jgi:hypothetical protein
VVFYDEQRDWWTPPAKLGVPKALDLITDPKEKYPQTGALKIRFKHESSHLSQKLA